MTATAIGDVSSRTGATLLLELLENEGVEYVFGNPGTTELPLMDALVDQPALRYILALQEASAVAMADGYAQASGKPGFLNLHTAGGLGHGMGNLLNAAIAQTPLVVTAGQQDSRHTITDPLLFGDIVRLGAPAVKWAQEVAHADQLPILVPRAFNDAVAPPPGPVLLSLPMDVMEETTRASVPARSTIERRNVGGSLGPLAEALAAIRPGRLALIAGDEVHTSGAGLRAAALAEMLGAPVYGSSWPSRIPFPTSHPQWAGNLPTRAVDIAGVLSNFDALLALGGKSLITILYTEGPAVPAECAVYQISADVRDLGRTFATPLSIVGDIDATLAALLPLLESATAPSRAERDALVVGARARRRAERSELAARADAEPPHGGISALVAAREVVRAIGSRMPIVDEAIVTSSLVRRFLDSDSPRQYSFLRGGALGWGMPAAVGCSLGIGREPVACLVGDGAALYSPQALWTAAHEKLPVLFVVMNNRQYDVLKAFMRSQPQYVSPLRNRYIAMDLVDPAIDYLALAASMGVPAARATRASDIGPMIEAAARSAGPALVEIAIASKG